MVQMSTNLGSTFAEASNCMGPTHKPTISGSYAADTGPSNDGGQMDGRTSVSLLFTSQVGNFTAGM